MIYRDWQSRTSRGQNLLKRFGFNWKHTEKQADRPLQLNCSENKQSQASQKVTAADFICNTASSLIPRLEFQLQRHAVLWLKHPSCSNSPGYAACSHHWYCDTIRVVWLQYWAASSEAKLVLWVRQRQKSTQGTAKHIHSLSVLSRCQRWNVWDSLQH